MTLQPLGAAVIGAGSLTADSSVSGSGGDVLGAVGVGWGMLGGDGGALPPLSRTPPGPVAMAASITGAGSMDAALSVSTFYLLFQGEGSLTADLSVAKPFSTSFIGVGSLAAVLTVERHRTVTLFVTTGFAVDSSLSIPVRMDAGTGTQQPNRSPEDVVIPRSAHFS